MAIARKSDASATGSLSQTTVRRGRNRPIVLLSTHREVALRSSQLRTNQTPLPAFSPPESSGKQKRLAKNVLSSTQQLALNASSTQRISTLQQEQRKQKVPRIPVMPSADSVPLWLLRLNTIHRHSSIVAFLLVAVTLLVYGWTVYSQELWSQSYRKRQNLERQERQLMTINGVLNNNMAKEAEKLPSKLVSPAPERMIFMSPAPVTPNPQPDTKTPIQRIQQQTLNPLGY